MAQIKVVPIKDNDYSWDTEKIIQENEDKGWSLHSSYMKNLIFLGKLILI